MTDSSLPRRAFLRGGIQAAGATIFGLHAAQALGQSTTDVCEATPPQTAGPFYPGEDQFEEDSDLTQIAGRPRAQGQVVYVRGTVRDPGCRPIANANVEIWQACVSGKYNHGRDPNPAPLDANFKYWGEAFTNANGEYLFKTIIPGAYPASGDWTRPPHIHFTISCLGYHELTTQMYFAGNPLNERDLILRQIPADERSRVVVEFTPSAPDLEPGTQTGTFAITLMPVR